MTDPGISPGAGDAPPPVRHRWLHAAALGIALSLILFGLVLAVSVNRGRALQVDEVQHIHVAYNLRSGLTLYRDFWEGHNPLLHLLLYPVVNPATPVESLTAARTVMLGMWLVTIAAAARISHRLSGSRWAAVATAGLLILHTTFVERGLEVRTDGLLAALTLLALGVEISGRPRRTRSALQGLVLGLAFLATQKAVFVCVAFGLTWLWAAFRRRRPALVLVPCLLWALPVTLMIAGLAATDSLESWLQINVHDAARHVTTRSAAFSPWPGIIQEGSRNLAFMAAATAGLVWGAVQLRRSPRPGLGVALLVAVTAVASLWLNPFPFPYLHVSVIPPLAVLAGTAMGAAGVPGSRRRAVLVASALLLAALTAWPRLMDKAMPSMDYQLTNLRTVQEVTRPEDPVFDLVGLYFRPDAYPVFTMTGVMMQRYRQGHFPRMIPALRRNGVVAILVNYRTRWLPEEEWGFLARRLIHYNANVFVLGTRIGDLAPGESLSFEALASRRFRFEGEGTLLVDGSPFRSGTLAQGPHVITAGEPPPRGRLLLDVPPPQEPLAPKPMYVNFD